MQCTIKIPDTVLLDKHGSPKEWIFNSGKLPSHPILKKRKENLTPLAIIKNLCGKYVHPNLITSYTNIYDLKEGMKTLLM